MGANREQYTAALGVDFDALIGQGQGLFLASDRSQFSTGGTFVVDGGLTASVL